jgi:hypothetical protein
MAHTTTVTTTTSSTSNNTFTAHTFTPQVRGPTYLADRIKAPAGSSAYTLLAVDLVSTPTAVQHLARFLPSIRCAYAQIDIDVCACMYTYAGCSVFCADFGGTHRSL